MSKKPRIRTLMHSQHVKGFETLHEYARQFFLACFFSLSNEISSKNSILVVTEILRLFVNILTPVDKYSFSVKASLYPQPIQMLWSQNQNIFPESFSAFTSSR